MHYADIKKVDVANGLGVRVSLFVSGCRHHCKGCFNEIAWNFKYGKEFDKKTVEEIENYLEPKHINGLSLLGGEPLEPENQEELLGLVKEVKEKYPDKTIWCYTGFDFEKDVMGKMCKDSKVAQELVNYLDVVVDGKFEADKMDKTLKFRGSSNQRLIDVKKTLQNKKVELLNI